MTASGTDPSPVAWAWARVLGAMQEAQRLGSTRVEVGHLLLTVYADPVVRGVLRRSGLDLRDVQPRVGALRHPDDQALLPGRPATPAVTDMAPEAAAVLDRLAQRVTGAAGTSTGPTSPGPSFAVVLRALAVLLLGEGSPAAVEELLGDLLPPEGRRRIARRLGGGAD